jgi:hypothetical protein
MINNNYKGVHMDIQANTKLFDLLKDYPHLEEKIMSIAPPFQNLKNPILRKTVGKLATLEKVAKIGNLEVMEFVNTLRKQVGQSEITPSDSSEIEWTEGEPEWIKEEPQFTVDGTEMLNRGEHPLNKVNELMRQTEPGRLLLLKTNFKPIPLIDEMEKQKYQVYSKVNATSEQNHLTFIKR